MTSRIKAHYDGRTIVPDEPFNWPTGTAVIVEVNQIDPEKPTREQRQQALDRIVKAGAGIESPISQESLRRENLYGDEGR